MVVEKRKKATKYKKPPSIKIFLTTRLKLNMKKPQTFQLKKSV